MSINEKYYEVPPAFSIDLGEISDVDDTPDNGLDKKPTTSVSTDSANLDIKPISDDSDDNDLETESREMASERQDNKFSLAGDDDATDDDDDDDDDDIDEEDNDKYSSYSDAAKIAIAEIKAGTFELDEKLIPKDLDANTLRKLYKKSNELRIQEEIENLSANAGEAAKYVKFLLEGGDPNVVKQAMEFKDIIALDPEDEDDQKIIIAEELKRKGLPQDEIDDLISSIIDKGRGKQRATSALNMFRKAEEDTLAHYKEQQAEYQRQQELAYQEYVSGIQDVISRGEVAGVRLSKKDQRDVFDALFTPTEIVSILGNDGKEHRTKVTKVQALQNQLNGDKEKIVAFALWLLKDSNFSFAKEQGKEEEVENLADILRGKRSKPITKREGKLDNLVGALTNKQRR